MIPRKQKLATFLHARSIGCNKKLANKKIDTYELKGLGVEEGGKTVRYEFKSSACDIHSNQ